MFPLCLHGFSASALVSSYCIDTLRLPVAVSIRVDDVWHPVMEWQPSRVFVPAFIVCVLLMGYGRVLGTKRV